MVKNPLANAGNLRDAKFDLWGQEAHLEGTATHSSIPAWRIPWTKEPGGLHSPPGCRELDTSEGT